MRIKRIVTHTFPIIIGLSFFVGFFPLVTVSADPLQLTISEIQGDWWYSDYQWQYVETTGIVTADFQYEEKRGFFMQDPVGDGNPDTSEGIFVYAPYYYGLLVDKGDEIKIVARVREYFSFTELDSVQSIEILSTGNDLPEPQELNPPTDNYWSDVYYEALEGMLVSASKAKVVGGTNQYGELALVKHNLGINRVFESDEDGTGEIIFTDDAGGLVVNARTGQIVMNLVGPLDYTFGQYKILPEADNPPKISPKHIWPWINTPKGHYRDLSIASYNMFNLFDDIVDPGKIQEPGASSLFSAEEVEIKVSKHAEAIHNYLKEPDLIAVQEVEKVDLLEQIVNKDVIESEYGAILVEGPDVRGINVGLMYRKDRVNILSYEVRQGCTTLDDGFGPDNDPDFPCDEGENHLFSRRPLVVHLETLTGNDMWLVINHFKSKSGGDAETTPRRVEQATFVASIVDGIQADNPEARVMVLGDLNDFEYRDPIVTLENSGLRNLVLDVRKQERYTFIFEGVSEVLDHMLITPSLEKSVKKTTILHFNPDFPFPLFADDPSTGIRSTDHDILMSFIDLSHGSHWHPWF